MCCNVADVCNLVHSYRICTVRTSAYACKQELLIWHAVGHCQCRQEFFSKARNFEAVSKHLDMHHASDDNVTCAVRKLLPRLGSLLRLKTLLVVYTKHFLSPVTHIWLKSWQKKFKLLRL